MKSFAQLTFEEVVSNYSDMLIRLVFQNTKNMADAEDIVQEVYIKLLDYKKDFQSLEHLKAWLIRVAINKCKDHFRTSWFRKVEPLAEDYDVMAPEEKEIFEALFELDKESRNIIYLHYYEGYKIKEIATIMKKNLNTINSKLQRGRQKLKLIIEEGESDEIKSLSTSF